MGQKYTSVAVSGYNSAPPSDDASQTDANKVKWSYSKIKLGDPLNTAIVAIDAALVTAFAQEALLKTTNYTTTAGDNGKLIEVTGTNTISLYDASTGGASYQVNVLNLGVGVVTVGRATAGNTINGVVGNWTLNPGNGASFRVNSTNNGYDVIATALTTGAGLADVLHTTGNESKAGVMTFTSSPIAQFANAYLTIRDTASTLPAGLWGLQGFNLGDFRLIRNTAAGGDFSTATSPLIITAADAATFLGTVSAATATAAAHLVRKDQLDAKVYGGQIANNGTASVTYGPSGWTVSRSGVGTTTVTHNLGTTSYAPVLTAFGATNIAAELTAIATNSFSVRTFVAHLASASDVGYTFTVSRN